MFICTHRNGSINRIRPPRIPVSQENVSGLAETFLDSQQPKQFNQANEQNSLQE